VLIPFRTFKLEFLMSDFMKMAGGRLMGFSGVDGQTNFKNGLVLRGSTLKSAFDIKFPGEGEIALSETGKGVFRGDWFDTGKTRGAFIDAFHFIIQGPSAVSLLDDKIKTVSNDGKTLIGTAAFFDASLLSTSVDEVISERKKWAGKFGWHDEILNAALSQIKTQIYAPGDSVRRYWTTPDIWPHKGMWLWDSVFHAIGLRHIDVSLAKDALDALLDVQADDGFIPLCHHPLYEKKTTLTQPPVLALGYKMVNEFAKDNEWIARAYPGLKKYIEWDMRNRDADGAGLPEWIIEANKNCRSGESGMDNSPRFDSAARMDAVDFSAMLALECEIMSGFAETAAPADKRLWLERHEKLCRLINERLWNEKHAFYFDYGIDRMELSDVMASSGFLPLMCGACSPERAKKLAAHLHDPASFGSPLPVPSISKKSERHYSKDMWRGPVWVNVNWLVALGFRRAGMTAEADMICSKTVAEIEKYFKEYHTFFEFFDDRQETAPPELLRKGCNDPSNPFHQVMFDYGWTATLYVDMKMNMT
jgi:glycogen debranching enzyme